MPVSEFKPVQAGTGLKGWKESPVHWKHFGCILEWSSWQVGNITQVQVGVFTSHGAKCSNGGGVALKVQVEPHHPTRIIDWH